MYFEKKHDTSLFDWVDYENEKIRLYHVDDDIPTKSNEFCFYLDYLIPQGYHFYIIYNKPNHNKIFTKDDLNFLGMDIEFINKLEVEPNHSETIQFFKKEKEKLLLYLENIQNLYFYFFIPRLFTDNKFYYDLLLLFKDQHNIKDVSDYSSSIILVDKILYLNNFNYNLNFFKFFFDFENETFRNSAQNKFQSEIVRKNLKNLLEWPEHIAFGNAVDNYRTTSQEEINRLEKIYYDRLNSSYDEIYYKKIAYQTLCKNWWIINKNWNKYPIWHYKYNPKFLDSQFEIDEFTYYCDIYKSVNVATIEYDKNGKAVWKPYLEWGSFCESLFSSPRDYNFFCGYTKNFK